MSNTEFFRRLAHALGCTEPWLYDSDEALVRTALDSPHPWLAGITFESLWEQGYARLKSPEDWRPFADGRFPTPSGKAELYSATLREQGLDPLPTVGDVPRAAGDELQLISAKTLHFLNSGYAQSERHVRREGRLWIDVHPEDAARREVSAGELVRVENERGFLIAECRVTERVRPGTVWMPFGGFGDAVGEPRSVNLLTPVEPTDWGGGSGFHDAFVKLVKLTPAAGE